MRSLIVFLMVGLLAMPAVYSEGSRSGENLTLNFVAADIESVARSLASITGRSVVVDPRVKGSLTLTSEHPVSPAQAWDQFLSALRLQSFAVVEVNGLWKILPEADAKLQGGTVNISGAANVRGGGQVVTQIFKLEHENANNLITVLRPLISPNNTINVTPGTNALVITDYADNLQRIGRIIASLDVTQASDIDVIALKHAVAVDLAPLVQRLLDSGVSNGAAPAAPAQAGQPAVADAIYKTTVIAESRSNSVVLRAANPTRLAQARSLVEKLDRPGGENPGGNIHVVYLKNAEATKLAATLRAAVAGDNRTGVGSLGGLTSTTPSTPAPGSAPGALGASNNNPLGGGSAFGNSNSNQASALGGMVQADATTNSLIITAPEPVYRQLRAVIDQLDNRRAQVLVESMIAEVDANRASQFGIQWQNVMGNSGGNVGIIGTNFNPGTTPSSAGAGNLFALAAGGATSVQQGLNIGSAQYVNGRYVLSTLANFLQQNGDSNILSTPTLLTLDNEEAKIVVGKNVPFITGQYTNNNVAGGSVNPFQTIERRDVGLTLRVRPQISETGTIRLTVYQEVSSLDSTTVGALSGPTTNKRSIESTVLVEDGQVVVLGGLLSDEYDYNKGQVPGLGDIPWLGALFRNENRTRNKTNLMVFLRPVVLRDGKASETLSNQRYQDMMRAQESTFKPADILAPIDNNVRLPALPNSK